MAYSRRQFCVQVAALALASDATARRAQAGMLDRPAIDGDAFFNWVECGGCMVGEPPKDKGLARCVAIMGSDGVALVDTSTSGLGAQLRREVEAKAKARVTHVINTSGLEGVTGGNHAFRGDSAVLCHPKAAELIAKQTGRYIAQVKETIVALKGRGAAELPELRADLARLHKEFSSIKADRFLPTREVAEAIDLDWTGPAVRVIPVGPACTAGDLIVHIVKANVLIVGSLAWPGVHPVVDRGAEGVGASVAGWRAALEKAIGLCDDKTVVVPSVGAWRAKAAPVEGEPARRKAAEQGTPTPDANGTHAVGVAMLRAQLDYFEKLRRIVVYAKDVESMPRKDVMALKTGAFEGLGETSRLKRNLGAMFDELAEEKPAGR